KEKAYDSVIFAYGTKEIFPPFEGREEANLILGTELLEHPEKAEGAENIVIVGGGVVGCETAHWLANEYGKHVTVLEMMPHFMTGVCTANRGHLLHYLEKAGVQLFNCTKVKALAKDGVYVEQNQSSTVPDPYNTWQPLLPPNIPNPMEKTIKEEIVEKKIPADLIVLAMGGKADETFFFEAGEEHLAKEMYNIGDSSRAGRVLEAVRGAYHLAVRI
ncbi:MAG: FAD-dependent oxidoreductase, partial [Mediterraneibacter gnavus]